MTSESPDIADLALTRIGPVTNKVRREIGQGNHHERPVAHAWMRHREVGLIDCFAVDPQDINIERAWAPPDLADALGFALEAAPDLEQFACRLRRLELDHDVEERVLLDTTNGVGFIQIGDPHHLVKRIKGANKQLVSIPEVRAEPEKCASHRDELRVTSACGASSSDGRRHELATGRAELAVGDLLDHCYGSWRCIDEASPNEIAGDEAAEPVAEFLMMDEDLLAGPEHVLELAIYKRQTGLV